MKHLPILAGPGFSRRAFVALLVALPAVLGAPPARSQQTPPEGILLGRWIVAPYFESSIEYQDNVFRRATDVESDRIHNVLGGVQASLPIRNSMLRLDYSANRREYGGRAFDRDVIQNGELQLELNFSTRDRLTLTEQYTRGISDVLAVDPGGELVFDGEPYNLNRLELEIARNVPRLQGYSIRVARVDLNFQAEAVPFFDYRGFESAFEFRQPMAPRKWLVAYYDSRRFNNYRIGSDVPVGVPFRREESDSVQIGLRGFRAGDRPFFARLGYGRLRYVGVEGQDFAGLVGEFRWRFPLNSRTHVNLNGVRRPFPSNFNTYYIVNEVRVGLEHGLRRVTARLELLLGRNRYGEQIDFAGCEDALRRDARRDLGANLEWRLHARAGLRLDAAHIRRGSNCGSARYEANQASVGVRFGWN